MEASHGHGADSEDSWENPPSEKSLDPNSTLSLIWLQPEQSVSLAELICSHVPSLPTTGVCVSMAKEEPSVFAEKDNRISATVRKPLTGEKFYDVSTGEEDAVEKIRDHKRMKHREMVVSQIRARAIRQVTVHVGTGSDYKPFQVNKGTRIRQQLGLTGQNRLLVYENQ